MRQASLAGMPISGFPHCSKLRKRGPCETVSHAIETRRATSGLHLIHSSMFNQCALREFFGTIHALYQCGEVLRRRPCQGGYPAGGRAEEANEGWPEEKA